MYVKEQIIIYFLTYDLRSITDIKQIACQYAFYNTDLFREIKCPDGTSGQLAV